MRTAHVLLLPAFVALAAGCAPAPAPVTACSAPAGAASAIAPPARPASSSAASSPAPAASSPVPAASASSAAPPSTPPPPAFQQALDAAKQAIAAGDYATADRRLEAAAPSVGDDPHLRFLVAYTRATRFAYAGDLESAASALVAVIPDLAKRPDSPDEFWAHNAMMMLREAQGDPAAALAENDQATLAAARGTWEPEDRDTLAYLKDRWHRAYLTRMLAETRTGSAKKALVGYAASALADYTARARQIGSNEDSIAVLEAYFAALDGDRAAAVTAAKKVDVAKDDDLEDLYLVVVGLEAGGDHAAAEAVRRRMQQADRVYLARAIMLRWLGDDAKGRGPTPWHPR